MTRTNQPALTAPQHAFDLPRVLVWALATAGHSSLSAAHALDAVLGSSGTRRDRSARPRARLGPSQTTQAKHLIPDSWRVR